jgi:hypothetical protein
MERTTQKSSISIWITSRTQRSLTEFVRNGHTIALPPHNKWVDILTCDGVIAKLSNAGTFDCAKYNFRIDDE